MGLRLTSMRQRVALAACGALLLLAGCGKFFPPLNSGGGGGGTSSGDYLYVGNLNSNDLNIAGFTFASSSLTSLSGSPFTAGGIAPMALAVTPNNEFLYVSGGVSQTINVYPINSNGTLGTGAVAGHVGPAAMQVDTTGGWLIGLDPELGEAYAYQINSSNGTLSQQLTSSVATAANCGLTNVPAGLNPGLVITPNDNYVYASCGTAGIYIFSFNSSNGQLTNIGQLPGPKNGGADLGLAIATLTSGSSTSYYLLAPETVTNGVRVFSIASNGQFSEIAQSPFSTGAGPDAVLVDHTDAYVYVTNRTSGNISGFTLGAGGALTPISGSPWGTGSWPVALVEDNSHTYIAAICSGGNADLETYTIGTSGVLASFKNSATGTDPSQASSVAATH
jgi:6-phosphogluconolactonase